MIFLVLSTVLVYYQATLDLKTDSYQDTTFQELHVI